MWVIRALGWGQAIRQRGGGMGRTMGGGRQNMVTNEHNRVKGE